MVIRERVDVETATALCHDECYWRDLLSLTWNLKTAESAGDVKQLLQSTLATTQPSNWQIDGQATEADGITEAWFTFETKVSRGKGLVRIRDGKAWTLLTTMVELKGFEEARGDTRPKGVEHGSHRGRKTWLASRQAEEAQLG